MILKGAALIGISLVLLGIGLYFADNSFFDQTFFTGFTVKEANPGGVKNESITINEGNLITGNVIKDMGRVSNEETEQADKDVGSSGIEASFNVSVVVVENESLN